MLLYSEAPQKEKVNFVKWLKLEIVFDPLIKSCKHVIQHWENGSGFQVVC